MLRKLFLLFTYSIAFSLSIQGACRADDESVTFEQSTFKLASANQAQAGSVRPLQCGIEMRQQKFDPNYELYVASQNYYQASLELQNKHYKLAADCYRKAANSYQLLGEGKAMANAKYGEAGALMLAKEDTRASQLFGEAMDLFAQCDKSSPFLKAAATYKQKLDSKLLRGMTSQNPGTLKRMEPKIDRNVVLKTKLTTLEDGTKLFNLKANDFFNGSRYMLPQAAALDVKEGFINDTIYKAFLKMDCLEFNALGSNYMNANNNYKTFKAGDKTIVIGASDQFWSPVVKIKIDNKEYGITMDLPGISKNSRNVLLATDGSHIIALDPRTLDTWRLSMTLNANSNAGDFSWIKLIHQKKNSQKRS